MKFKASRLTVDYVDAIEDLRQNIQTLNDVRAQVEPLMPAGQQQPGAQQPGAQQQQQGQPGAQPGPQNQQQGPGQQQPGGQQQGPQPQGPGQQQQGPGPQPQPGPQNQQGPGQQQQQQGPGGQQQGPQQGPVNRATLMREIQRILQENMADLRLIFNVFLNDPRQDRNEVAQKVKDKIRDLQSLDIQELQDLLEILQYLLDDIEGFRKKYQEQQSKQDDQAPELGQGVQLLESKLAELRDFTTRGTTIPQPLNLVLKLTSPQGQQVFNGPVIEFLNSAPDVVERIEQPGAREVVAKDLSKWVDNIILMLKKRTELYEHLGRKLSDLKNLKSLPASVPEDKETLERTGQEMLKKIEIAPVEITQGEAKEKLVVDGNLLAESLMNAYQKAQEQLESGEVTTELETRKEKERVPITSIPLVKGILSPELIPSDKLITSINAAISKGQSFKDSEEASAAVDSLGRIKDHVQTMVSAFDEVSSVADLKSGKLNSNEFMFTLDYGINGNPDSIEPFYLRDIDFKQEAGKTLVEGLTALYKGAKSLSDELSESKAVLEADLTKTTEKVEENEDGQKVEESQETLNLFEEAFKGFDLEKNTKEIVRKLGRMVKGQPTMVYTRMVFHIILNLLRGFARKRGQLASNEMIMLDSEFANNMRSEGKPNQSINTNELNRLILALKPEGPFKRSFYEKDQDPQEAQTISVLLIPFNKVLQSSQKKN